MAHIETKATDDGLRTRQELYDLFEKIYSDKNIDLHLLFSNLGIFLRNSTLAKILFVNELYQSIADIPGTILEFGCHLGQNLALFEALRAIYEPFNIQRRIVGFDTFALAGYASRDDEIDGSSPEITEGGYRLPSSYPNTLRALLAYHESNSVVPGHKRCEVVEGDVVQTVPKFIADHPGEVVALAYFDLATYKPTTTCLEAIYPRLVPGSVLLMDELNFRSYPGASAALLNFSREVGMRYEIRTSPFMRDRSIITFVG